MRLPQELVEGIIDYFSDDSTMLVTFSLVAKSWLARSRCHLFSKIALSKESARKWQSLIPPGPDGLSCLVRSLSLLQAPASRWLDPESLDVISDHLFSFQQVENLLVTWLYLDDFEPASLARHFGHFGPSLRSLRLSYLAADYSALMTFLQLFPNLQDLHIHTPELNDDNPPLRISRTGPIIRGSLNLTRLNLHSSPFISHLADLDLRFSSISAYNCDFSSGLPLINLLDASASSLRKLELEYVTFCKFYVSFPRNTPVNLPPSQICRLVPYPL